MKLPPWVCRKLFGTGCIFLGSPTLVGCLKLYCCPFFFPWHFSQQQHRGRPSNHMHSGGSVVGTASLIDPEISPTPPLIFTEGSKSAKFGLIFHITQTLSHPRLKMRQDIWTVKQICYAAMTALCSRRVWWSSVHACLRTIGRKCLPL